VIRRKISEGRSWHYTKDEFPKNTEHIRDVIETLRFHMISCNGIVEREVSAMNGKKVIIIKSVGQVKLPSFPSQVIRHSPKPSSNQCRILPD
jgi:hypothetical protein